MAQWICMRLPSCSPGSNPNLRFFNLVSNCTQNLCSYCERDENKQERGRVGPFKKAFLVRSVDLTSPSWAKLSQLFPYFFPF